MWENRRLRKYAPVDEKFAQFSTNKGLSLIDDIFALGMYRVHPLHSGQRGTCVALAQSSSENRIQDRRAWQQCMRHWTRPCQTSANKSRLIALAASTDNEIADQQDAFSNDEDDETDYVVIGSGIGGKLPPKPLAPTLATAERDQ